MYDSYSDTVHHIKRVRTLVHACARDLEIRGQEHDKSKLSDPEKSVFDAVTPKLKELKFGTAEYEAQLKEMSFALDHHYSQNDHHPQHFPNGIHDMNLINIIEMLCDWKAAGERMADGGNIYTSIEVNQKRFGFTDDVKNLLINTARYLKWET